MPIVGNEENEKEEDEAAADAEDDVMDGAADDVEDGEADVGEAVWAMTGDAMSKKDTKRVNSICEEAIAEAQN